MADLASRARIAGSGIPEADVTVLLGKLDGIEGRIERAAFLSANPGSVAAVAALGGVPGSAASNTALAALKVDSALAVAERESLASMSASGLMAAAVTERAARSTDRVSRIQATNTMLGQLATAAAAADAALASLATAMASMRTLATQIEGQRIFPLSVVDAVAGPETVRRAALAAGIETAPQSASRADGQTFAARAATITLNGPDRALAGL